jgi:hypothetical protein
MVVSLCPALARGPCARIRIGAEDGARRDLGAGFSRRALGPSGSLRREATPTTVELSDTTSWSAFSRAFVATVDPEEATRKQQATDADRGDLLSG